MDTSLSDIFEARGTITTYLMMQNAWAHLDLSVNIIICQKSWQTSILKNFKI